jgi:NADH dehydrogenase
MARRVVTVFGGSGFIGRHLVRRLAASGAIVRAAVRDTQAALYLKTMGEVGQIVPFGCDITDPALAAAAVADAGAVVNLVGILSEWGRRRTFQRLHVDGAANVARAATAAGVRRLVQVSALGADATAASLYGRTKAAGEEAVVAAFPGATIVRPSVVFGPEDKFFNRFAAMASLTPALPVFGCPVFPKVTLSGEGPPLRIDIYGTGGTRFQPVYVGDVADAIMAALARPEAPGKVYELGGPKVYSFKDIMELMLRQTARRRLLVPLPFAVARVYAWFLEKWPQPVLTRDQLRLLERDNVVGAGALTLQDLGVEATAAETILPSYLGRFRPPRLHGSRAA